MDNSVCLDLAEIVSCIIGDRVPFPGEDLSFSEELSLFGRLPLIATSACIAKHLQKYADCKISFENIYKKLCSQAFLTINKIIENIPPLCHLYVSLWEICEYMISACAFSPCNIKQGEKMIVLGPPLQH